MPCLHKSGDEVENSGAGYAIDRNSDAKCSELRLILHFDSNWSHMVWVKPASRDPRLPCVDYYSFNAACPASFNWGTGMNSVGCRAID